VFSLFFLQQFFLSFFAFFRKNGGKKTFL